MRMRRNHPAHPERGGIAFIDRPRLHQHVAYRVDHRVVIAEGQPRPFFRDPLGGQFRIPDQTSEAIQIRLCQGVPRPVLIISDVGNGGDPAVFHTVQGTVHDLLHLGPRPIRIGIEIQYLFPLRHQIAYVTPPPVYSWAT